MSCTVRQVVTTCSQGRGSAGSNAAGTGRRVSSASSGRHAAYDLGGVVGPVLAAGMGSCLLTTRRRPCRTSTTAWPRTWTRCGSWRGTMLTWSARSGSGTPR
uniref:Uncharacterized protein n=1 Tax=Malurus cyaneus samueli TaxID=2593467 RepID=A0A8C5X7X1_9PASS